MHVPLYVFIALTSVRTNTFYTLSNGETRLHVRSSLAFQVSLGDGVRGLQGTKEPWHRIDVSLGSFGCAVVVALVRCSS